MIPFLIPQSFQMFSEGLKAPSTWQPAWATSGPWTHLLFGVWWIWSWPQVVTSLEWLLRKGNCSSNDIKQPYFSRMLSLVSYCNSARCLFILHSYKVLLFKVLQLMAIQALDATTIDPATAPGSPFEGCKNTKSQSLTSFPNFSGHLSNTLYGLYEAVYSPFPMNVSGVQLPASMHLWWNIVEYVEASNEQVAGYFPWNARRRPKWPETRPLFQLDVSQLGTFMVNTTALVIMRTSPNRLVVFGPIPTHIGVGTL